MNIFLSRPIWVRDDPNSTYIEGCITMVTAYFNQLWPISHKDIDRSWINKLLARIVSSPVHNVRYSNRLFYHSIWTELVGNMKR